DSGLAFGEPDEGGGGSLFLPHAESRTATIRRLRIGATIVPRAVDDCDPTAHPEPSNPRRTGTARPDQRTGTAGTRKLESADRCAARPRTRHLSPHDRELELDGAQHCVARELSDRAQRGPKPAWILGVLGRVAMRPVDRE